MFQKDLLQGKRILITGGGTGLGNGGGVRLTGGDAIDTVCAGARAIGAAGEGIADSASPPESGAALTASFVSTGCACGARGPPDRTIYNTAAAATLAPVTRAIAHGRACCTRSNDPKRTEVVRKIPCKLRYSFTAARAAVAVTTPVPSA